MSRFAIEFDTDNAAFEQYGEAESVEILQKVVAKVQAGYREGKLFDSNGNMVGRWDWS